VCNPDFSLADLPKGGTDVFLQFDAEVLKNNVGVVRILLGAMFQAMQGQERAKGAESVLFCLDEVDALGYMSALEEARDRGRKFGISLMMLYQSVGQLEKHFGKEGAVAWFDSAAIVSYAVVTSPETADRISKQAGECTVEVEGTSERSNWWFGIWAKGAQGQSRMTYSTSLSVAKRLPAQNILEVSYVGTFGRHLLNRSQFNVIQPGALSSGVIGNSDLSVPVNRVALSSDVITAQRPYPALSEVRWWEFKGYSNYHSLQATLSRQTGRRLQYFVAYTFSKALGTSYSNGEYDNLDPFDVGKNYGVLRYDRTHIINLSYNYMFPDVTKKGGFLGSLVNGWQLSGITTYASGNPYNVTFTGDLASTSTTQAWYGTPDGVAYRISDQFGSANGTVAPLLSCDPRLGGASVGEKVLDVGCIGIPSFGQTGDNIAPYYIRLPSRMNWDISVFKNFAIGQGGKKLQFRAGFFNIFNMAAPSLNSQDIDLNLQTTCNVRVNGVPNGAGGTADNVCDPTQGFSLTDNTIQNFGKIILQRGHRVIEFALKFYF